VVRPDFPRSIIEFQRWFPDDEGCRDYLISSRWSEGFRCPRCDEQVAVLLAQRLLWQCSACRYQVSLTAGTVLHGTRRPLHLWFWAAYLMSTGTPGISAVQLQRQLGIKRYETAWMMLHKLRRAMVNPERTPLTGPVEVDECFVGGLEHGLRGGRQRGTKALVVVAVEVRGAGSGRLRMQVISDASADTLCRFVQDAVAPGANVHTDGWPSYRRLLGTTRQMPSAAKSPGFSSAARCRNRSRSSRAEANSAMRRSRSTACRARSATTCAHGGPCASRTATT